MTNQEAVEILSAPTRTGLLALSNAFGGTANSAGRAIWCAALNLDSDRQVNREDSALVCEKYRGRVEAGIDTL